MSSARRTALRRAWLVTKPFLMPAIAARFASKPRGPGFRRVLTAQAFSWGGDIALMGEGRRPFLAGLGSFLVGHLAYVSAFRSRSSVPLLASPGRRRFLAGGALLSGGMALAAGRKDPKLAVPVAAYGATLATMVASAAAIDHDRGRGLVLPGAALFLLSDSLIGVRMFLAGERTAALDAGVMTTYIAAQWCISEGMTRA
jgi:uncharacterized membrane protein YhhN